MSVLYKGLANFQFCFIYINYYSQMVGCIENLNLLLYICYLE